MCSTLPAASAACLHRISHITMSDGTGYDVNVVYRDDLGREIALPEGYDDCCMFRDHPEMKKEIDHQLRLIAESHSAIASKPFSEISVIQIRDEGIYFDHKHVSEHGIAVKADLNEAYEKTFGTSFDRVGSVWAKAREHLAADYNHHMKAFDESRLQMQFSFDHREAIPEAHMLRRRDAGLADASLRPAAVDGGTAMPIAPVDATHVPHGPPSPVHSTGPAALPTLPPTLAGDVIEAGLDTHAPGPRTDETTAPMRAAVHSHPAASSSWLSLPSVTDWIPGKSLVSKGTSWVSRKLYGEQVPMGASIKPEFMEEKVRGFNQYIVSDLKAENGLYDGFKKKYGLILQEIQDEADRIGASHSQEQIHRQAAHKFAATHRRLIKDELFIEPIQHGLAQLRKDAYVNAESDSREPSIRAVIEAFSRIRTEALRIPEGTNESEKLYIQSYKNFLRQVIQDQLEMALIDYFKQFYNGSTGSEARRIPNRHFLEVVTEANTLGFEGRIQPGISRDYQQFKQIVSNAITSRPDSFHIFS